MKAVIDALGLAHYRVFAQDSGAVIARELALIDGERMIALAMANTEIPGHRPPKTLVATQAKMSMRPHALVDRILRRKLDDAEFLQSTAGFGDSFHDPRYVLGEFRRAILQPITRDAVRSEGARRFLAGWDWDELDSLARRHARMDMPVLLVWGEDDRTFPLAQAERMRSQFPRCEGLVRIANAKLLVHEERPAEVAAALLAFFE
jgi:pimeloyl-ACP methyl ester carboxylesterase